MSRSSAPDGNRPPGAGRRRQRAAVLLPVGLLIIGIFAGTWWVLTRPAAEDRPGDTGGTPNTSQDGLASTWTQPRLAVNQTSVITGLSPGSPPQELRGTFTNPHEGPLRVNSLTAEVTATSRPECPVEDFVIAGTPARVDADVAPGTHKGSWSGLTIRMRNRPLNQDACKDTLVTIRYTVQ